LSAGQIPAISERHRREGVDCGVDVSYRRFWRVFVQTVVKDLAHDAKVVEEIVRRHVARGEHDLRPRDVIGEKDGRLGLDGDAEVVEVKPRVLAATDFSERSVTRKDFGTPLCVPLSNLAGEQLDVEADVVHEAM
jgi:hypothetical protein